MKGHVSECIRRQMGNAIRTKKAEVEHVSHEISMLQSKIDGLIEQQSQLLDEIEECSSIIMALNRVRWEDQGLL